MSNRITALICARVNNATQKTFDCRISSPNENWLSSALDIPRISPSVEFTHDTHTRALLLHMSYTCCLRCRTFSSFLSFASCWCVKMERDPVSKILSSMPSLALGATCVTTLQTRTPRTHSALISDQEEHATRPRHFLNRTTTMSLRITFTSILICDYGSASSSVAIFILHFLMNVYSINSST